MCYCCNMSDAVRHCLEECAELLPGEFVGVSWLLGIAYCVEYIIFGSESAHSHIVAYIGLLVAILVGATVLLFCIRIHDVRLTVKHSYIYGGKCYNCGKEIKDAD